MRDAESVSGPFAETNAPATRVLITYGISEYRAVIACALSIAAVTHFRAARMVVGHVRVFGAT